MCAIIYLKCGGNVHFACIEHPAHLLFTLAAYVWQSREDLEAQLSQVIQMEITGFSIQ